MTDTPPPSFWKSQFQTPPTRSQITFDVIFGILMPLFCLYFDPFIFKASMLPPLMGGFSDLAYAAIGLGLASLTTWLLFRRPAALLAGLLAGGALFAFLTGIILLPLSVVSLVFLIGLLGFTPFFTSFVFARNAFRAYRSSSFKKLTATPLATSALTFFCLFPPAIHFYIDFEISRLIKSSNEPELNRSINSLKWFRGLANFERLPFAWQKEPNPQHRQRLANAFRQLTGSDIENSWSILND